ncbi:MAG: hypothetical protein RIR12_316 [Bacteroidota bacterium]|jgi:hypothetical protein
MATRTILYFLYLLFLVSCGITKTKLSSDELKWVNVYKEGDILIFKSELGEFDTSVILRKSIYYPEYIPYEVHDKYLPQEGVILYKNKNLKYHSDSSELLHITKRAPKNQTRLFIDYLYSKVIILDVTSGEVEKYKRGEIYEFDTYHPKAKSTEPKKIFWHEDYGIIKYITHADVIWERINLPK